LGLEGGFVRKWTDRKTNFELISGRSIAEDREPRYFGLMHGYQWKPKRRLFDILKSRGLQANEDVTFLSNSGDEVRAPRSWSHLPASTCSTGSTSRCA